MIAWHRVEEARILADHIPGARLAEFEGEDHFPHIGDTAGWLTAVEMFIAGTSNDRPRHPRGTRSRPVTRIRTLGGFCVNRDGHDVAASSWGSRRARQLCKRLAAAAGSPVPREQLIDLLWPDDPETPGRLGARLSVQLSTVRRILGGGVIADRTSIRLDPTAVHIDIVDLEAAIQAGDFDAALSCYHGPFLPEDLYEDWTVVTRERAHASFVTAARQLVTPRTPTGISTKRSDTPSTGSAPTSTTTRPTTPSSPPTSRSADDERPSEPMTPTANACPNSQCRLSASTRSPETRSDVPNPTGA